MIVYRELSSLEQDLGINAKTLYAVSNNLRKHYHKAKLPKKNGGYRNLSVPDEILKSIQKQIAEVLLIHMPYPDMLRHIGLAVPPCTMPSIMWVSRWC